MFRDKIKGVLTQHGIIGKLTPVHVVYEKHKKYSENVINIALFLTLSFRTDRSGQTVQTQIRLLLEDQGLHFLTKYPDVWPLFLNFR